MRGPPKKNSSKSFLMWNQMTEQGHGRKTIKFKSVARANKP